MEKLENYRQIIQEILREYTAVPIHNGEIESYTAFDLKDDHYQVIDVGWDSDRRVYGCVLHLDIKDCKIWVQHNMTELQIAQELVNRGVEKKQIVIGFHAPELREYTEYAVA
ncbi:MAG: XisI protein [Cyanobacteria bacterium P01_G01_bin.54]